MPRRSSRTQRTGDGRHHIAPDATKQNSTLDAFAADAAILRIILPDLMPEGMTILAGKPKVGKSWFALDVCLAAADENRFDSKPADDGLDIPRFLDRRPGAVPHDRRPAPGPPGDSLDDLA